MIVVPVFAITGIHRPSTKVLEANHLLMGLYFRSSVGTSCMADNPKEAKRSAVCCLSTG
jgi:hypothetical protein